MLEKSESTNPLQKNIETIQEIASRNFGLWNKALQTENPEEIAALYLIDATFLPTTSDEFKKGQYCAKKYFEHILKKNPTAKIIQEEIQILGTNCYLHSGMYNFEVGLSSDRQVVKARFSFLWKKDDQGKWKIVHHHSSVRPTG